MSNLNEKINQIASLDVADRHSQFQLIYFVIGKEPTRQAKMWRCVRELQARQESTLAMENEELEIQDRIDLLKIERRRMEELQSNKHQFDAEMIDADEMQIKIRQIGRKITSLDHTLKTIERKKKYIQEESAVFVDVFEHLEAVEPFKPFDDKQAQIEYWNEKLTQELNMKLLLHHPLDGELVKTILSLTDDIPVKQHTVRLLEGLQKADERACLPNKR